MINGITSIFLFVYVYSFQFANAQKLITGRVVDSATGKYIKNVSILNVDTEDKTFTNDFGFFQMAVTGSTKLQLSCEQYVTAQVEISGKENVKIEMIRRRYVAGKPIMEGPMFLGGLPALYEYIGKNMRVPPGAPKGIVTVQIYIDSEGSVVKDSVKIIQSLCKACDWEALRVMKKSPKWSPAEPGGNSPILIPIKFN